MCFTEADDAWTWMGFRSYSTKLFKAHFLITQLFMLWKLVRQGTITIIEFHHLQPVVGRTSRRHLSPLVHKLLLTDPVHFKDYGISVEKSRFVFQKDVSEKNHSLVSQIMIISLLPLGVCMWPILTILLFFSFRFLSFSVKNYIHQAFDSFVILFIDACRVPISFKGVMAYCFSCLLRYPQLFTDHWMFATCRLSLLLHLSHLANVHPFISGNARISSAVKFLCTVSS